MIEGQLSQITVVLGGAFGVITAIAVNAIHKRHQRSQELQNNKKMTQQEFEYIRRRKEICAGWKSIIEQMEVEQTRIRERLNQELHSKDGYTPSKPCSSRSYPAIPPATQALVSNTIQEKPKRKRRSKEEIALERANKEYESWFPKDYHPRDTWNCLEQTKGGKQATQQIRFGGH